MNDSMWDLAADQLEALLEFMPGFDLGFGGDGAYAAFMAFPEDQLSGAPLPQLVVRYRHFASMDQRTLQTIFATLGNRRMRPGFRNRSA